MNTSARELGLSIAGLKKSYGSNDVLRGVDLTFRLGEVHALLGPNGAGKSTLLGCLSGAVTPDEGTITVRGEEHTGFSPVSAFAAGTSIIYQQFQLIGDLSVSDNVFLGSELRTPSGAIDRQSQRRKASDILRTLNTSFSVDVPVSALSVGEQQLVEIARSLRHDPSVLILDEPTAALSKVETEALLELCRKLAHDRGIAVVFVSHILREVLEVADVVTVLRDGEVLWTRPIGELALTDLIEGISGQTAARTDHSRRIGEAVIASVSEFRSSFTGPVSIDIHEHEIVGSFGLLGSGRTDLLESLAGVRSATAGEVIINGRTADLCSPLRAQQSGVALVASDRKMQSLFGEMSALDNLVLPHYRTLSRVTRRTSIERRLFAETASRLNLLPPSPFQDGAEFSGGNAQKLMVGRWTCSTANTELLLLDEPTQGVDVGARYELYELLRGFISDGRRAILFASSDPDEIVALADRALVLVEGSVAAVLRKGEITEARLLHLAHAPLTNISAKGLNKP